MTDTLYLSVGARFIHAWLAVTPRLRLLRGASLALETCTANVEITGWLQKRHLHAATAADAGDLPGAVVLEVEDPAELVDVASELLDHLALQLPGLHWEGWARTAASYVEAFAHHASYLNGKSDVGPMASFALRPEVNEYGLLASCPGCGAETALRHLSHDPLEPRPEPYGWDCDIRYSTDREARRSPMTLGVPGRKATDFDDLAAFGGIPRDGDVALALGRADSRSHLAVVCADANGVAKFFEELAKAGGDYAHMRARAVELLSRRTRRSVLEAALKAAPGVEKAGVRVVESHYIGGDDALLSVPAVHAWTFAQELISSFEGIRSELDKLLPETAAAHKRSGESEQPRDSIADLIDRLSLGVGLVFAHSSRPFADVLTVAERAQKAAKRFTGGKRSAIAYTDLTVDGEARRIFVVEPVALSSTGGLASVLEMSTSARAMLGGALEARSQRAHGSSSSSASEIVNRLRKHQTRLGVDLGLPVGPCEEDAAQILEELRALLVRGRWWPSGHATKGGSTP